MLVGADRDAIEQAERQLRAAMLSSDVAVLDRLLSDDLVFTDQDGRRLSKADDMAAHQSGLLRIKALEVQGEPLIRVRDDAAIVCVTLDLAGAYDGQEFGGTFAYTRMWHRNDGRWQVEAAHCSPGSAGSMLSFAT